MIINEIGFNSKTSSDFPQKIKMSKTSTKSIWERFPGKDSLNGLSLGERLSPFDFSTLDSITS